MRIQPPWISKIEDCPEVFGRKRVLNSLKQKTNVKQIPEYATD